MDIKEEHASIYRVLDTFVICIVALLVLYIIPPVVRRYREAHPKAEPTVEEYIDNEEKVRAGTKLTNFRSLDKLPEIKIPRVKLIDDTYIDYEDYKPSTNNSTQTKSVEITDADLPF